MPDNDTDQSPDDKLDQDIRNLNADNADKFYYDYYYNQLKIQKSKKDDFDLFKLSSHISNSLTDQIYRGYLPSMEKKFVDELRNDGGQKDGEIENDLNVGRLAQTIKLKLETALTEAVVEKMQKKVLEEMDGQYQAESKIERAIDFLIRNMRWVFAPVFLMAIFVIVAIFGMMVVEIAAMMGSLGKMGVAFSADMSFIGIKSSQNTVVASILAILDLFLLGSLVIMVVVGGYENTISRIGTRHNTPTWFGKLNISQLKTKVAASIVIISSIHLLTAFMQLDPTTVAQGDYNTEALMWTSIVHVVFVVAALALAVMDRYSDHES